MRRAEIARLPAALRRRLRRRRGDRRRRGGALSTAQNGAVELSEGEELARGRAGVLPRADDPQEVVPDSEEEGGEHAALHHRDPAPAMNLLP